MGIPRVIHQTWKTENIPYDIYRKKWVDSWRKFHPDWEYNLWTNKDNKVFIQKNYPWFLKIYEDYSKDIFRADAVRYFILYHYGGLYVDLDFECLKKIETLLENYDLVFGRMGENQSFLHSIPNAFMVSAQGNPFWLEVFKELIRRKNIDQVEEATGSVMLYKVIVSYQKKAWLRKIFFARKERIKIYDASYFFPINWQEKSIYHNTCDYETMRDVEKMYPKAYAVTYWTHNW